MTTASKSASRATGRMKGKCYSRECDLFVLGNSAIRKMPLIDEDDSLARAHVLLVKGQSGGNHKITSTIQTRSPPGGGLFCY